VFYARITTIRCSKQSQNPWDRAHSRREDRESPHRIMAANDDASVARDGAGTMHLLYVGPRSWRLEPVVYRTGTPSVSGQTTWQAPSARRRPSHFIYSATIGQPTRHTPRIPLGPRSKNTYTKGYAATRWAYLRSVNGG